LKLNLIASTPGVDVLIATAMLTTTSSATPSNLYKRLSENPERVREIVGRLEVQHGSILEHNRIDWLMEAGEGEVLRVLLTNRFFTFTRLGSNRWIVSANMRTILEYVEEGGEFADLLLDSIKEKWPQIHALGRRSQ
jgi:hypothetical protein